MIALFYLLGFLSGFAAHIVLCLIKKAKRAQSEQHDKPESGFLNIINY